MKTKTIQRVPTSKPIPVFSKTIMAVFARWAIQQSPYDMPDQLEKTALDFHRRVKALLSKHAKPIVIAADFYEVTEEHLRAIVKASILTIRQCRKWNTPKANPKAKHVFCSRYDRPKPDYDIIDLDALAGNIVRSIIQEKDL